MRLFLVSLLLLVVAVLAEPQSYSLRRHHHRFFSHEEAEPLLRAGKLKHPSAPLAGNKFRAGSTIPVQVCLSVCLFVYSLSHVTF